MSVLTFEYTKQGSTESKPKVVIALSNPSDKYFGIDITELDLEEQGSITAEIWDEVLKHKERLAEIMFKYDIKHNYRYYFPEKMENLIIED